MDLWFILAVVSAVALGISIVALLLAIYAARGT